MRNVVRQRRLMRVRDEHERRVQRVAARGLRAGWAQVRPFIRRIRKDAGEDDAWSDWGAAFSDELSAAIVAATADIADVEGEYFTDAGYSSDIVDINAIYARYLSQTGSRITNIPQTTRAQVSSTVTDWMTSDESMGDLLERLGQWFGEDRAETIAITEITTLGSAATKDIMLKADKSMFIWFTRNDGNICEDCLPLHGQEFDVNNDEMPPLHVRCRCGAAPAE